MKSLISRESHRPDKRYSGVYHIQGGMVTDADLDERSRITLDRTDHLGDDTIKDGVPAQGGAVTVSKDGKELSLAEGVVYADGVRGELVAVPGKEPTQPLELFGVQADFPFSPALPSGAEQVIYADIWERPVFPLEDPYLADVGLHGAVTAFRTRTMTQLKAAPAAAKDEIEAGKDNFPQIGTAPLKITPLNAEILADDCDPCADVVSAAQTIANALWRLEVIDVEGTPQAPGKITLAWSIENAAAIAAADVDPEDFERPNKIYEFYSEITESHLGVFAKASDAKRAAFVDDLNTTPSPANNHDGRPWPFVRRWDGQAVVNSGPSTISSKMGGGFQISVTGKVVKLTVDAFEAELSFSGASVVAGDYWLVELRRFAPETDRVRLVSEQPIGIRHHYCVLFNVDASGEIITPSDAERRKLSFPVLPDLPATHVGFDNSCDKLYGAAENVQQALDNLCDISADDIGFTSNCPELYDSADNVQDALDALCKIDFSVHGSFRLLFDWGVVCGLVPSLDKIGTGTVTITPGSFLDRSGRITRYDGGTVDLNKLELKKGIQFNTPDQLNAALKAGDACLALAAEDGGIVSVHVVPKSLAFGPDDPGFAEQVRRCMQDKKGVSIRDFVAKLPKKQQEVAGKIQLASTGGGIFRGSAKLSVAEAKDAVAVNDKLAKEIEKVAEKQDIEVLKQRVQQAKKENALGNAQGAAREVRQMQQATAIFAALLRTEDERLRRCICQALFPTCPPDLGKAPFYVPIACLRGVFDNSQFFLQEVCPFCCRKQAMTWRSLQYFIGDRRDEVARKLKETCCGPKDDDGGGTRPPIKVPGTFADATITDFIANNNVADSFIGKRPEKEPDFGMKIPINDLSELEAKKTLLGNGVEIAETIDINDGNAFGIITEKSVGLTPTDLLSSADAARPGDKVGLLVQDGVARGFVVLERGTGKLPFPTQTKKFSTAVSKKDEVRVKELVTAADAVKGQLTELAGLRETLSADVVKLKVDVDALNAERELSLAAVKDVESQLGKLAEARIAITKEVETVNTELVAAEENRKKVVIAVRESQPITAVAGNADTAMIARLAGAGVVSVADMSALSNAEIRRLTDRGVLKATEARTLKRNANTFLARPL